MISKRSDNGLFEQRRTCADWGKSVQGVQHTPGGEWLILLRIFPINLVGCTQAVLIIWIFNSNYPSFQQQPNLTMIGVLLDNGQFAEWIQKIVIWIDTSMPFEYGLQHHSTVERLYSCRWKLPQAAMLKVSRYCNALYQQMLEFRDLREQFCKLQWKWAILRM